MNSFSTEHRRLAAIMFTDMVGYSALSQRNEALALELLEEHRQLLREVFPKHQGQEIKSTGDGFLVEFASALAAVQCAVEIQHLLRARNASRSAERRVLVRIGIHLGDVVRRENDVFGDGVNIAARIEPLAEPGGVCVSRAVYEQIANKVDHALVQLNRPSLKNIQATVEVYRLLLDEPRATPAPAKKSSRNLVVIAGLALAVLVLGVAVFLKFRSPPITGTAGTNAVSSAISTQVTSPTSLLPVQAEFRVLHSVGPTNVEGVNPWGILTLGSDGFIYGSTVNSGPAGGGSLYRLRTNGTDYAVLRNFDPVKDGQGPEGVIEGRDGGLYGVTYIGGAQGAGVIFRVARDGSDFRVLHHFASRGDCRNPQCELLEAKDGMLYGTAMGGGGAAAGGVFRIAKDGSGYSIVTGFVRGEPDDPRHPMGALIQGTDGAFYGTTRAGGVNDKGTVYRLEASGKLTVLKSIGTLPNGLMQPWSALRQDRDGWLYGTCTLGGAAGGGALFRLTTDGSSFQIRQFGINSGEARELYTSVLEAADGSLLGTSNAGGAADLGTVFRIAKDGSDYQTLHSFRGGGADGARPRAPLTVGAPGVFYGATTIGGNSRCGVIFQLTIPELARAATASGQTGKAVNQLAR